MTEISVINQKGTEVGKVRLTGDLWDGDVQEHVLHLAVKQELANRRQGTHATKTRSEVSGSGRKPWRQKGTGRARAGSIRSPLWRHGGVVFGPHPRSYRFDLPKQVRKLAIAGALRNLLASHKLIVLDSLELPEAKTKLLLGLLKNLAAEQALIIFKKADEKILRASRNLPYVKCLTATQLNVYDLVRSKKVLITKEALTAISEVGS